MRFQPLARRGLRRLMAAAAACATACVLGLSAGTAARADSPPGGVAVANAASTTTHTVTYADYSYMIDGKRVYLWSGEFHYFRLPSQGLWLDVLQKMKAAGFNAVTIYFDWGYHSPAPGVYDFTGVRDVDKLLDMAAQVGLYVIARPSPYINAEVDGGGFPGWLDAKAGNDRHNDPTYLAYVDQWLSQIDPILARHQLTNGTGSVIEYQIENEYGNGNADGRAYMQHLEDKARADGITVPLVGNSSSAFDSGTGAVDVNGADDYPEGFNCSNPTVWKPVPNVASFNPQLGKPLVTPEFQGGAFDPWGGPGYAKCDQLVNDQFADVFYKQNIAVGATSQNFYMTYGGTSWGWLSEPQNYTSYDYAAAIRENRQLDAKYYEDKLMGYFTQAVTPLTKTGPLAWTTIDNSAITDTARINPDTGTQFHVLRHTDSTSTSTDSTHVTINMGAHPGYGYDDTASAVAYNGTWTHATNQTWTGGDYDNTESFSNAAGDSASFTFTGTGAMWVSSLDPSHGNADVYLDGAKVATVDLYASSKHYQYQGYKVSGLTQGTHTLKIVVDGTKDAAASNSFVPVDAFDVQGGSNSTVYTVPQQAGTAITLNGRESTIIVANYNLGGNQLQYSTSQIMTNTTIGGQDIAVLYGDHGSDGEAVLNYPVKPTVTATGGTVTSTWDPTTGDLRLNYQHAGLTRVEITGGTHPLLLLIADTATADNVWQTSAADGPILVIGTHLVRSANSIGNQLNLSGDNATDPSIEVYSAASQLTWNGVPVMARQTSTGSLAGAIPVAAPITLPALTDWKHIQESPESQPGFNDSSWQVANETTTNSITTPGSVPILFADDYGFHTGDTWYRGHFTATGQETGITLGTLSGDQAVASSVWLNGTFLGSSTSNGQHTYTFPASVLNVGGDNVISVLTVDMGHEEDYNATNYNKTARGLTGAVMNGASDTVTWRIQGVRGGEDTVDMVRGPLNTGGLYGERAGYMLPGYPTGKWQSVTLPTTDTNPGVSWYITTTTLHLPQGQDTSLGLNIADDPSRKYRAEIYVNGWDMGNYINYVGPQNSFPIPNGVINPHGKNTIAIAVWNLDGTAGGLGAVSLTDYGSYASSLVVPMNDSPGYNPVTYAMPEPATATVELQTANTVAAAQQITATATLSIPPGKPAGTNLSANLQIPTGWSAVQTSGPPSTAIIEPGSTATFTWLLTSTSTVAEVNTLTVAASLHQCGRNVTATDARIVLPEQNAASTAARSGRLIHPLP